MEIVLLPQIQTLRLRARTLAPPPPRCAARASSMCLSHLCKLGETVRSCWLSWGARRTPSARVPVQWVPCRGSQPGSKWDACPLCLCQGPLLLLQPVHGKLWRLLDPLTPPGCGFCHVHPREPPPVWRGNDQGACAPRGMHTRQKGTSLSLSLVTRTWRW